MIIFSTVFKILNKLKGNLILYTVILLAITLFNTTSGNMNHYEATKPDILIVNKDRNNEITKGFVSYLKEQATLKDIDINDQEKVDDALFYRDISYVVYIPVCLEIVSRIVFADPVKSIKSNAPSFIFRLNIILNNSGSSLAKRI